MAVAATLLFGSLARADHSSGSDTDLLMVSLDDETRHVSVGHLSLFLYPWRQLEQDARDGDLFVCHLVREAKPLIDPDNYLPRLQQAFHFRSNYTADIQRASDLAWFLVSFGAELNRHLLTKRALWCIRTLLIARSAERRDPVFAPERLAEQTSSVLAQILLRDRRGNHNKAAVRKALYQFLIDDHGGERSMEHVERDTFLNRFVTTSNKVALQTLGQEEKSEAGYL